MLKKIAVVAFSVTLAGGLIWHRATEGRPPDALPSSKSGRALDIYASDFAERYPAASPIAADHYAFSMPSNPQFYTVVCSGSKHMGAGITVGDFPKCTSVKGLVERP